MLDPTTAIGALLAALGLSGAAGLNAWVPLLAAALAQRGGALELADPYAQLATDPGIAVLAGGLALDFVGDKVALVDHALHAVGMALHPIAGAIVAAGQAGADVPSPVLLAAGALTSGSVHAGRATLRPLVTGTTLGLGNPAVSLLEDAGSALLSLLAVLIPLLAAVALLLALLAFPFVLAALLRRRRRLRAAAPAAPPPRPTFTQRS